jgi:hypothetical protein
MSFDSSAPIPPRPPFTVALPRVLNIVMRRVPFQPPELVHFKSRLAHYQEAIEFIVETDGDVPTRNFGPALFIGDEEVHDSERLGKTTWRFLAFELDRLQTGAPIDWGWMKDRREARLPTGFRYDPS